MKNFQITSQEDGQKYWIGRAVAVSTMVFRTNKDSFSILANKRGKGLSNHVGLWNCPCGYLDYDETAQEGAIREIKEECGINIPVDSLMMYEVETSPTTYNQNVTIRFIAVLTIVPEEISIGIEGEVDEVEEVAWIEIKDIDNYQWAFNHDEIIKRAFNNLVCKIKIINKN